jgi:hypothetical protein
MRFEENKIILCSCRRGSNCPTIHRKENGGVEITDDYNGKISLTEEELFMLTDAVEAYKNKLDQV